MRAAAWGSEIWSEQLFFRLESPKPMLLKHICWFWPWHKPLCCFCYIKNMCFSGVTGLWLSSKANNQGELHQAMRNYIEQPLVIRNKNLIQDKMVDPELKRRMEKMEVNATHNISSGLGPFLLHKAEMQVDLMQTAQKRGVQCSLYAREQRKEGRKTRLTLIVAFISATVSSSVGNW